MQRVITVAVLAPGMGENETIAEQIDIILDFARHFKYPGYHELAQKLAPIANAHESDFCKDVDQETLQVIFDSQDEVLAFSFERLNDDPEILGNVLGLAGRMKDDPDRPMHLEKARVAEVLTKNFDEMFSEVVRTYHPYSKWVAKILWNQDNLFADMMAIIHWRFMTEMLLEVNTWRMARQVSFARNCAV